MPEQFAAICEANSQALLEFDAKGRIIHLPPTVGDTGALNGELVFQRKALVSGISAWQVFASAIGFRLPECSVLSSDA